MRTGCISYILIEFCNLWHRTSCWKCDRLFLQDCISSLEAENLLRGPPSMLRTIHVALARFWNSGYVDLAREKWIWLDGSCFHKPPNLNMESSELAELFWYHNAIGLERPATHFALREESDCGDKSSVVSSLPWMDIRMFECGERPHFALRERIVDNRFSLSERNVPWRRSKNCISASTEHRWFLHFHQRSHNSKDFILLKTNNK